MKKYEVDLMDILKGKYKVQEEFCEFEEWETELAPMDRIIQIYE